MMTAFSNYALTAMKHEVRKLLRLVKIVLFPPRTPLFASLPPAASAAKLLPLLPTRSSQSPLFNPVKRVSPEKTLVFENLGSGPIPPSGFLPIAGLFFLFHLALPLVNPFLNVERVLPTPGWKHPALQRVVLMPFVTCFSF